MIKKTMLIFICVLCSCCSKERNSIKKESTKNTLQNTDVLRLKDKNILASIIKKLGQDTVIPTFSTSLTTDRKKIIFGSNAYGYITSISISGHKIDNIPEELYELDSLEILSLWYSNISDINKLKFSSKIKRLGIRGAKLSGEILLGNKFSKLEELSLVNNQITSIKIDENFTYALKVLNLNINKLSHLDTSINNLRELRELSLINNQITTLQGIKPPKLNRLHLSQNPNLDTLAIKKQIPENCVTSY